MGRSFRELMICDYVVARTAVQVTAQIEDRALVEIEAAAVAAGTVCLGRRGLPDAQQVAAWSDLPVWVPRSEAKLHPTNNT